MIEFLILTCVAYTLIDLTAWILRNLPDWLVR